MITVDERIQAVLATLGLSIDDVDDAAIQALRRHLQSDDEAPDVDPMADAIRRKVGAADPQQHYALNGDQLLNSLKSRLGIPADEGDTEWPT